MLTIEHCREVAKNKPEFREIDKGSYIVFDYSLTTPTTFDCDVSREMRGIAFDKMTGAIISRPFHKFFNLNEKSEVSESAIDFSQTHTIMKKLDGSMIRPIITDIHTLDYVLGTRAGETEVSEKATQFLIQSGQLKKYDTFINYCISGGEMYTPIFEFCSREQQIVIDYPESSLTLTAIRNNVTGSYLSYDIVSGLGNHYGIPVVDVMNSISPSDFCSFVTMIRNLKGEEGVVIRFDSGLMLKMKGDDYVLKHKTLDGLRFEKDVIALHFANLLDDMYPILGAEKSDRIRSYLYDFSFAMEQKESKIRREFIYVMNSMGCKDDRKAFAEAIKDSPNKSILFGMFSGKNLSDQMRTLARKACSSQTTIDEFKKFIEFEGNYYGV